MKNEEYLEKINYIMWQTWGVKDAPFGREEGEKIMEVLNEWAKEENEVFDDLKYTDHFLTWRNKYFEERVIVKRFISKSSAALFDDKELEDKYERGFGLKAKRELK